jgi:hypothetical protein
VFDTPSTPLIFPFPLFHPPSCIAVITRRMGVMHQHRPRRSLALLAPRAASAMASKPAPVLLRKRAYADGKPKKLGVTRLADAEPSTRRPLGGATPRRACLSRRAALTPRRAPRCRRHQRGRRAGCSAGGARGARRGSGSVPGHSPHNHARRLHADRRAWTCRRPRRPWAWCTTCRSWGTAVRTQHQLLQR